MQDEMNEATRLTRDGRLAEATALIQRTLGGRPGGASGGVDSSEHPGSGSATFPHRGARRRTGWVPRGPGWGQGEPGFRWGQRGSGSGQGAEGAPGAGLRDGSFTNAAGTRGYKLYVPTAAAGRDMPLVVMLHGCTQTAADFAAGTRMNELAERDGFLVAYPEQVAKANQRRCWNWFLPAHQRRDAGEPSLLAGITRQVLATHQVDPARVFVAGLSAGGAMAAVLAATYPDLYAAAGIHSGLAHGAARDVQSAYAAMRQGPTAGTDGHGPGIPLIVFQGGRDTTVAPANATALLGPWSRTATAEVTEGPGWTRRAYRDRDGKVVAEWWTVHALGHAWSGGSREGSFADPDGPDASAELVRFFNDQAGGGHSGGGRGRLALPRPLRSLFGGGR
ncbi:MAG TPA: PHB depolymerase family esterase [Actinomycetes bacterium]|nr:PHB depolymerase family esterase [Actinomycetes bacterium]